MVHAGKYRVLCHCDFGELSRVEERSDAAISNFRLLSEDNSLPRIDRTNFLLAGKVTPLLLGLLQLLHYPVIHFRIVDFQPSQQ